MLWLYRLLYLPALLLAAPFYLRRRWRRGGYRRSLSDRLGAWRDPLGPKRPGLVRLWIQAVSVGELNALEPLLRRLREEGGWEVFLTTTTTTGFALIESRLRPLVAGAGYFPLDFAPFPARAWGRLQPDVAAVMESELWPEHLEQARRRGVPLLVLNGRLSDRSFRRWSRFPGPARWVLSRATRILAGSPGDADRFRALLGPGRAARVEAVGNLKFDVAPPDEPGACARADLGDELGLGDGPVLLGASTWPGEEEALLRALARLRERGWPAKLLLVPRHAERRTELAALLTGGPWRWHLRSRGVAPDEVDVTVADTTGELRRFLPLARIVFVGKSLGIHREGQTPIEAAAAARPIVFGPGMANFRQAARELVEVGAAEVVPDAAALVSAVERGWPDEAGRERSGAAAAAWYRSNRGAVARTEAVLSQVRAALPR